jgi:hypothetical protein
MEALAIVAALALSIGACGCIMWVVRQCTRPAMKASRSDTDLTNLVGDSLPTGRSPV